MKNYKRVRNDENSWKEIYGKISTHCQSHFQIIEVEEMLSDNDFVKAELKHHQILKL